MAFDWAEVLGVAQAIAELESVGSREARLRTAVSRAYYAAYNRALQYCERQGRRFTRTSRDHELVREYLVSLDLDELADHLYRMHQWRKQADYSDRLSFDVALMWVGAAGGAKAIFEQTST